MLGPYYSHSLNVFYRIALVILFLASLCVAQDGSNRRGFSPGNSFSLGDFETINTTNGNLMLSFPLGALPAGRNGLSAGLNLYYNSKLYDSETQWFVDPNGSCNMVGEPGEAIMVCPYYQKSVLKESSQGGWQFGSVYSLTLLDRHDQFNNVPQELKPQCWNPNWQAYSPGAQEMRYHYKLMLNFPDGSSHEMRPNGWTDGNFNDPLGDWFDIRPDGYWHDCINTQWYQNTITYYSIDGSFLRLDIQHDGNTAGAWTDNPWTLYFPDGSKVTNNQPNSEPQRFYDRNNNYVELLGGEVRDQFNRSVSLSTSWENGLPVWTVTSQGFGQALAWTIHWKWISVLKNYWPCAESLNCPPDVQQQEPYGMPRLVIDRITMPAQAEGLTYQFQYNAPNHVPGQPLTASVGWGEISGITLPSGAQASYEWAQNGPQPASATPDVLKNVPTSKVLTYNEEYDGTSTPITETWTYDITPSGGSTVTAPDGGITTTVFVDASSPTWNAGLTLWTIGPDGTKTETIWDRNSLASSGSANPYPKTIFTSIKSGTSYVKTAIKDYKYDKNGNVTRVAEYDWVNYGDVPRDAGNMPTALPAVPPTRVTVSTYFNSTPDASQLAGSNTNVYWSSGSPRVKNAIASTEIRKVLPGGAESTVTRTEYTYDNPSVPANVTQVRSWDSTKGAYTNPLTSGNSLVATTQYNQYGMPTLISDARGVKTFTTYGLIGSVTDLYPTQIKTAYQTAQERTESREYHLATGLVTRVTDMDNNVAIATTFDALGRPILVTAAEGKLEETKTGYEYSDFLRRVITRSDLNESGDGKLVSIQHYDQLGRVRLSRQLEDAAQSAIDETTGIKVQTRYRFSGENSYALVSNAYRASTSGAASGESTMGWTRSKSDNTGKVIEVQTFGGAGLPAPWGSNSTSTGTVATTYDANFTTVSDQAQKQRRSVLDGLGRLIRVDEPNASGVLGDTVAPNQPTHYTYDVLGNLTKVTQSDGTTTQQRDFVYSSLSRLMQATNSESGSLDYKYDESGNLIVKTDARGVSTHYSYDALNRVTRRWYNGSNSISATTHESTLPGGAATTDEVKFYYDSQPSLNGDPDYQLGAAKGRLVAQTYGNGTNGDYLAYDNLGRVTLKYQQTGTTNYRVEASYNRANAITQLKYPSDRTVNHAYDPAGRLTIVDGNLGGTQRTYSTSVIYSPSGAVTKEQFGTNTAIYNKLFYNSRGQLAEIRASTSYTGPTDYSADRGAIVNNYSNNCTGICSGTSMPDNNGNLRKQEIQIPGQTMRWQEYTYDSLNRLEQAREVVNGGAEQWKQKFIYDRWGNRRIDTAVTYGVGINNKAFDVISANNRLTVPAGQSGVMQYDSVGNLTNDTYTGMGTRTYDAENKMTSAVGVNNQAQLYAYDGSGQRITRSVNGLETWQVYGIAGELLAEYPVNGAVAYPQQEYGYRNGQLLIITEPRTNVALAANGATASASSQVSTNYPAYSTINGDRRGLNWNNGGGWNDGTVNTHPDWLQIDFNGSKTIDEINVITLQDTPATPAEPTESMTFTLYGLTGYSVQYWNGTAWTTVSGGTVSGNNKVWRKFTFAPITTTKIRVLTSSSPDAYSRITEVEAWGNEATPARTNFALGGLTSASSQINANYPAFSTINGDRRGLNWNFGGGWNDATVNTHPDWLQIDFNSSKTIDEINVFTLQDNPATPAEPTESMTFSLYGLTAYDVQYWNNSTWVTIPGGSVTGNNKVWRKFTFSPITTSKIRVLTKASLEHYSRITEIEAHGPTEPSASAGIKWLVADQLGTPRMIFDQTGDLANMKRHDYLPFGEELFSPTGGRNAAQGYSGDGVRQQFTSYERDNETSLDFGQARYYSSSQGRYARPDPYNIIFEMKAGRNARERAQMLRAYISEPQNWNRYTYCLNDPVNLFDPSGLIWLTQDNQTYIWIDDDEYEKNQKQYADYSVANGSITTYQGSSNCPQCQGLTKGDLVQLNENGQIVKLDPNEAVNVYPGAEVQTYTSYSIGYRIVSMGGIVSSNRQIYPTFGFGPTWANYSYSQTEGTGPAQPGIYLQGSVANGLAVNESLNLLHPTAGLSREVGWGTPNAGVSIQVVLPALEGTTPSDWAYHPDNPRRRGLRWHSVGRCPY